jgi:hypothetical protein
MITGGLIMHIKFGFLCAALVLSTPAHSQVYSQFAPDASLYPAAVGDFGHSFKYDAASVAARLRAVCSSRDPFDKTSCARGMRILKKAYAEYKLRAATRSAVPK